MYILIYLDNVSHLFTVVRSVVLVRIYCVFYYQDYFKISGNKHECMEADYLKKRGKGYGYKANCSLLLFWFIYQNYGFVLVIQPPPKKCYQCFYAVMATFKMKAS